MASNIKQVREGIKAEWLDFLTEAVQRRGDETLQTASNEFAVPVVDGEGGEHYVVITIKIPTGSRDGEAYDGYAAAEDYTMKCNAKAAKQAEKERKEAERKSKGSK
ncbi:MAG: hypothetical protein J6S32_01335 [Clostridia bacterium]|nr:hypothetical protein [Clostridia bacterium]